MFPLTGQIFCFKLEAFLWREICSGALSPRKRGSITTWIEPAGYLWGLFHPRASEMESQMIDEHGSNFTRTYYDVNLSKPKIKAIKLNFMYLRFGKQ